MEKLYKMIWGVGLPLSRVFNCHGGLYTQYLGYGSGGHAISFFYKREEFKMDVATEDNVRSLAYVHGSYEELMGGKMCVVRCPLFTFTGTILDIDTILNPGQSNEFTLPKGTTVYKLAEKKLKSIKTESGKTLIFIGETANGNYKVVIK